jgi:membrane fusion protein (multidrug efflux system)
VKRKLAVAVAAVAVLAAIGYGVHAWRYSTRHVWTDDAYVEGTISPISAKVAGHVIELRVNDHQAVQKGEILLRIDPRDFLARRDQAKAAVAVAEANYRASMSELPLARAVTRAGVDQGQAALESSVVAVKGTESTVEESRARLEARRAATTALQAELSGAESAHRQAARELERMRRLVKSDFVAQREFDVAEAAFDSTRAAMEAAQRRLLQSEKEIQQLEAELAARIHAVEQARQRVAESKAALAGAESQRHQVSVKEAEVARAEARLQEAKADLAFAELQLEHTEVRAPLDGVVSKRSVEVGQVVQMGQPLMAIVPLQDVWVVANFKETQLARVRPGMRAEVAVDGYPDRVFVGTVESISAGTGARFSLLPPENATGNWVKVVQRVPVKILLDAKQFGNPHTLRAGMSAIVTVRVR